MQTIDNLINKSDTEIILEIGELKQESATSPQRHIKALNTDSQTMLYNITTKKAKIIKLTDLSLENKTESNDEYIKFETIKFYSVSIEKEYDHSVYSTIFYTTIELPSGINQSDILTICFNKYFIDIVNNVDYTEFPKLSIKISPEYVCSFNNIELKYKVDDKQYEYWSYDTDDLYDPINDPDMLNIRSLDKVEISDLNIKKLSEDIKIKNVKSEIGENQHLNTKYEISFSENEGDINLYDNIIANKNKKFKIIRIINETSDDFRIEEYRDCVLQNMPSFTENNDVNKYIYNFISYIKIDK